ncbi:MAG: hypothetical protein U1C56_02405, partial [Candidatus Curtissbacteria bacterium]|nr:hypothetical protein [Candidatus Curtissbacteria bacterium]
FGFVAGILLMVILDLAIIFGMTDKTKVAKLNQEQNREAAIQEIIISGFTNLGNVLGVNTSISPKSSPKKSTKAEDVLNSYWQLPPSDSQKFKELLCPK